MNKPKVSPEVLVGKLRDLDVFLKSFSFDERDLKLIEKTLIVMLEATRKLMKRGEP